MAMLAEPRRKQKYSVNPRGTDWSKDDNKFGQKLLEKMGWNKGKGLGANEDGRTDHVGIKFKADNKGVGCSNKYVDNWIEHQDDFNDLLQCLNQNHDTSTGNQEDEPDQHSVASLENKSKKSRSRVHYMKFTKGKDLSSRSKEDLACIFGERKHKKKDRKTVEEEVIHEVVQEVTVTKNEDIENNHGVQTFTNSCSIQEYFALKMKQRKQTLQKSDPSPPSSELTIKSDDEAKSDDDIHTRTNSSMNKSKRVSFNLDYQCFEDNTYTNIREKSLKSKKKKKKHNLEVSSEDSETETKKSNKKSKKKKKVTEVETEMDEEVHAEINAVEVESGVVKTKKKKKSKKRVREVEEEVENEDSVPKRKKKKSKKKVQEEEIEVVEQTKNKLLKKKKKGLRKKEANCNGSVDVLNQKPVRTEYHAIDQHKWKCSESLTSDQVKTICTSFKGADIHKIVGYLNSGPVATDYYS
ncbi:PIN2/TERF1-interacting telomerase inhibitor 1 [Patella vulgata]|uniref:PIN2/TERF1-interacting telomerase inhibitor 1 n=1 Tax=Patella vulgata TaxID=6465 RepID=UPI00217F58CC|nr:PIN2/TERF1-interacting telomerase inhibitor 1 [Patella vulgata]